jgi:glycosyltransferase involved in cell wall biosynthesis
VYSYYRIVVKFLPDKIMRRRLRIAQVAPIIESVPPKKYGGSERVVHALTEELVKKGHEVTLYASGDSQTSAKLVSVYPRSLREARMKDLYLMNDLTILNTGIVYKTEEKFDIIHDHNAPFSLPIANMSRTPVVITMHNHFTVTNRYLFQTFTRAHLVAISQSQADSAKNAKVSGVIYNGLSMKHYPFSLKSDGYLLYVGRISPEKGLHHAIEVAQILNTPLVIAAKLDPKDMQYYKEYIEQSLSNEYVKWVGEVGEKERNELMSKALCLLHPVTWKEPFGLSMIEAMATGCPVIAFNQGSIPEIIEDGKTGFIVHDIQEMVEAVMRIDTIDRYECRRHVLFKFNAQNMTDSYEKLYYKIVAESQIVPGYMRKSS